jgi:hypothetical protein
MMSFRVLKRSFVLIFKFVKQIKFSILVADETFYKDPSFTLQGSILVCQIFTIMAEISDDIYGRNKNCIIVFFPSITKVNFVKITGK